MSEAREMSEARPEPVVVTPGRFPALRKLAARGRKRRVPFVQQMEATDCGAACLSMVLRLHGLNVRLEKIRAAVGTDGGGASALNVLRAGEQFGLRGRGLKIEQSELANLSPGTVLHWEFNHFVVFESVSRRGVCIVDPGLGRRIVSWDRIGDALTGVAIAFEPSERFEPSTEGDGSATWSFVRQLLSRSGGISRIVVTSVFLQICALALPILMGLIVDRVVPHADSDLLVVVGIGLAGLIVFQLLSSIVRAHLLLQLRTTLDTQMTLGFIEHLVSLPYAFFQRRSAGDLMMRVNSNATLRELVTSNTLSAIIDGVLVSFYLLLIFMLSPTLGMIVLGLAILQLLVFAVTRRQVRDLVAHNLEAQARSQSLLVQLLSGVETLKAAGAEQRGVQRWSHLFADELNVSLERARLSAYIESALLALRTGAPLVVLSYGAVQVIGGEMSLGTMLAMTALATGFLNPLSSLVSSALQLQQMSGYVERIDDVLSVAPERDASAREPVPLRGHVAVQDVSFRYGPNAPLAVRNASITIEPGQSVALVGRSGSGKSTLASLLVGLHEASTGSVRYDGQALAELDLRSVRRQIGIVPQTPYFFDSSIRDNIALADSEIPLEKVVAAARLACIHDDIIEMPMGYETVLADRGESLSGGQRQRIALARALVNRPAVMLLDEATSALDTETEAQVMSNLKAIRTTRILIAHRLSTIADADLILVVDGGAIVERGTHEELLALGGVYRSLVAAQMKLDGTDTSRRDRDGSTSFSRLPDGIDGRARRGAVSVRQRRAAH